MPEKKPRAFAGFLFAVVAILALGAWLRLDQIDRTPPFVDEGGHVLAGLDPGVRDAIDPIGEGKPGMLWVFAGAQAWSRDPLVPARATSALAGLVTAAAIGVTLFVFSGPPAALIGLGLWALFPYAVFHERLALLDPFVACFTACALAAAALASAPGSTAKRLLLAALAGALLGAACAVKITGILTLLWLALGYVLLQRRFAQPLWDRRCLAFGAGFLAPLLPFAGSLQHLGERLSQRNLLPAADAHGVLASVATGIAGHLSSYLRWSFGYGGWPLALLIAAAVAAAWLSRERRGLGFAAAWLLSLALAGAVYHQAYARYTLADHVPFVIFLGAALALPFSADAPRLRISYAVVLTIAAFAWFRVDWQIARTPQLAPIPADEIAQYLTGPWSGAGSEDVTQLLVQRATHDHVSIVVFTQRFAKPGAYALMLAARRTSGFTVVPATFDSPLAVGAMKAAVARARKILGPRLAVFVLAEGPFLDEAATLQNAGVRTTTVLNHIRPDGISGFALLECDPVTM